MNATVFLCLPAEQPAPISGSVRGRCIECRRALWLAPSSFDALAVTQRQGGFAIVLCLHCTDALDCTEIEVDPPTPAQLREIADE